MNTLANSPTHFPEVAVLTGSELERLGPGLLADESRRCGTAEMLAFPGDVVGVSTVLSLARQRGLPVTVSAGRTGVVAGAVPEGGALLCLERMGGVHGVGFDECTGELRLRCGPALTLAALQRAVASAHPPLTAPLDEAGDAALARLRREHGQWIFACDPTEPSAHVGGMAATNASGAATFRYGPMRAHVRGLTVVLANGDIVEIRRGQCLARRGETLLINDGRGGGLRVPVPGYTIPQTKHAAGYHSAPTLDLIDLFIGSEGTLGVIAGVELALTRVCGRWIEVAIPLSSPTAICRLVTGARRLWRPSGGPVLTAPGVTAPAIGGPGELVALEFADAAAIDLVRRLDPDAVPFSSLSDGGGYVFAALRTDPDPTAVLSALENLAADAGADPGSIRVALGAPDLARFKQFRHAVPEAVNRVIAARRAQSPSLTKLGTDMAVPDDRLTDIMDLYRDQLAREGLEHVVFGHIGDNHLHVNILPRDAAEYARGRQIYELFATEVVRFGGSVSAEHGIGKLKRYLLDIQFNASAIAEMRAIKTTLDPDWMLGRGTLFAPA